MSFSGTPIDDSNLHHVSRQFLVFFILFATHDCLLEDVFLFESTYDGWLVDPKKQSIENRFNLYRTVRHE